MLERILILIFSSAWAIASPALAQGNSTVVQDTLEECLSWMQAPEQPIEWSHFAGGVDLSLVVGPANALTDPTTLYLLGRESVDFSASAFILQGAAQTQWNQSCLLFLFNEPYDERLAVPDGPEQFRNVMSFMKQDPRFTEGEYQLDKNDYSSSNHFYHCGREYNINILFIESHPTDRPDRESIHVYRDTPPSGHADERLNICNE